MSIDVNALLDSNLDDLADLPEFVVFPAGTHNVRISWEQKEVNNDPSIELKMVIIDTVELADPTQTPPAVGSESSVLFKLNNEFAQGSLKAILKPLAAATGTSSISGVMEASNGMEVTVVTSVRSNKEKTQSYTNVKKILI